MEVIRTILGSLLGATATIMAISVGLVSIIPALLELARTHSPEYFASEELRDQLRRNLKVIAHTIWMFGIVQVLCLAGLLTPHCWLVIAACAGWCITVALLLGFGFRVATVAIESMRPHENP